MLVDLIELGNVSETIILGEPVRTITYREVFAKKRSVRQSEFYQGANVGLKPELVFEVRTLEFENDEKIRYLGKEYDIIRTYDKGELTELTVTSHIGGEI
ncbi:MAG: hypothetical protein K0M69_08270 [Youngiibacter sp.]|nr:hypothetical protein [Youngiibacter sp.]